MDFLKEFEEYLPEWSNKKHLPIPTKKHMGKWYLAWNDFVKEKLVPRWNSIKQEYKELKLKEKVSEEPQIITEPVVIEEEESMEETQEEDLSDWEKVKKLLN